MVSVTEQPQRQLLNHSDFNELMRMRAEAAHLRQENAALKKASSEFARSAAPTELVAEIARHKLNYADTMLLRLQERFQAGAISQADVDYDRIAREMAEAELSKDVPRMRRLKYELSERCLAESTANLTTALGTGVHDYANFDRDIALAELNDNALEVLGSSRKRPNRAFISLKPVSQKAKPHTNTIYE